MLFQSHRCLNNARLSKSSGFNVDQLESLIAKREKLVTLKASLMHDLLTGLVRLSNNHLQTVGAL